MAGMLGAQLYTCRDFCKTEKDLRETLKKVKDAGYQSVQLSGIAGDIPAKTIAQALKDTGLICAATHVGWNQYLQDFDGLVEQHKTWECTHTAIGGLGGEYQTPEGLDRFVEELKPVAEKLAAEGMDFSYHNHNHEFVRINGKTWIETLYDKAGPDILKAELDVYWVTAGGGDPAAWVRKLGARQPLLHLKDMAMHVEDGKKEQRFAEIGEGNLNWPAILDAAKDVGVEYYLVEQDQCYDRTPFESLAISYKNLSAMGLK